MYYEMTRDSETQSTVTEINYTETSIEPGWQKTQFGRITSEFQHGDLRITSLSVNEKLSRKFKINQSAKIETPMRLKDLLKRELSRKSKKKQQIQSTLRKETGQCCRVRSNGNFSKL